MGVALYIVAERAVPGLDTFVNGKALGRTKPRQLDKLAQAAGVPPLMGYFSVSPDEAAAVAEDLGAETPAGGFPPERWFPAADGLATVRGLQTHLAAPNAVREAEAIREDLREFERVLSALAAAGVRWHLAVDY